MLKALLGIGRLACLSLDLLAQNCPAGQSLLKNDNLPANLNPVPQVGLIQGVCEGDAVGCVFSTVSTLGLGVRLRSAHVGFFSNQGFAGLQAAVDLEIFDGIAWCGTKPVLGPSVFRWSNAVPMNLLPVGTHGLNSTPDLTPYNIVITSGKLVCV